MVIDKSTLFGKDKFNIYMDHDELCTVNDALIAYMEEIKDNYRLHREAEVLLASIRRVL